MWPVVGGARFSALSAFSGAGWRGSAYPSHGNMRNFPKWRAVGQRRKPRERSSSLESSLWCVRAPALHSLEAELKDSGRNSSAAALAVSLLVGIEAAFERVLEQPMSVLGSLPTMTDLLSVHGSLSPTIHSSRSGSSIVLFAYHSPVAGAVKASPRSSPSL